MSNGSWLKISMKHLLTVVGTRPQLIKAAPVGRALKAAGIQETMVDTGQHYDWEMAGTFYKSLGLDFERAVNLSVGSGPHGAQTGAMLGAIEKVLLERKPECVLVYGDTNSTLAAALAAVKLHIPVAHVEAGLRSFNMRMPEEINRIVADRVSTWLFCPTQTAVGNLAKEGRAEGVSLVGDVMYDAALIFGAEAERQSTILDKLGLTPKSYCLATLHRAENTDDPGRLGALAKALARVAREMPVVLPLHPRTVKALAAHGLRGALEAEANVRICPPQDYLEMMMLEKNAAVIATDSGGVQKEAFFHRVPCVILRSETEWVELLELGWTRMMPEWTEEILAKAILGAVGTKGKDAAPFGDGNASGAIASVVAKSSGAAHSR